MKINFLCMNIHKGHGWGRNHTFHLLQTHLQELRPDLIFFQEIFTLDAEHLVQESATYLSYGKNAIYMKKGYGNAIFSRYPIIFSENFDISMHRFEHRGLLYAIGLLPSNQKIHLLCTHLGLFKKSRQKQLEIIVKHIETHIPKDDPIIVAGDFNDWGLHATQPLVNELQLSEAFLTIKGSYARTYPAWASTLKLDRVYYRGIKILSAERLITKSWKRLSDHLGLNIIIELTI
jgi:endonuclease/exonuclease/phosphatase family metal-dependent hydrolase